jgi:hypothetical protein
VRAGACDHKEIYYDRKGSQSYFVSLLSLGGFAAQSGHAQLSGELFSKMFRANFGSLLTSPVKTSA